MKISNIIFPGSFTVVGESHNKLMNGSFVVTNTVKKPVINKIGYVGIGDPNDISETGVYGKTGIISEKYGIYHQPIPKATVLVKKDGYIIDKAITDELGNYVVFVENGIYDIDIKASALTRTIKNYEITDGVNEVYCSIVSGEIFQRHYDVVEFINDDGDDIFSPYNNWLVNGIILDPKNDPVEGAEIVITDGELIVTYFKTKEDGEYHFLLSYGTYDVRIRLPKQNVKIAEEVRFGGREGFMPGVIKKLN